MGRLKKIYFPTNRQVIWLFADSIFFNRSFSHNFD